MRIVKLINLITLVLVLLGISSLVYALTDQESLKLLQEKFLKGEISEATYLRLEKQFKSSIAGEAKTEPSTSPAMKGINILKNGSFEQGAELPEGWRKWSSTMIARVDSTVAKEGKQSLCLNARDNPGWGGGFSLRPTEPLDPYAPKRSANYIFSGYMKLSARPKEGGEVFVHVYEYNGGNFPHGVEVYHHTFNWNESAIGGWQKVSGAFTTTNKMDTLIVACYNRKSGIIAWFDDFKLIAVPSKGTGEKVQKPVATPAVVDKDKLAVNPDGAKVEGNRVVGWGLYDWTDSAKIFRANEGHNTSYSVCYTITKFNDKGQNISALILGSSNGFMGKDAFDCTPLKSRFKLTFWAKGDMPKLQLDFLGWVNKRGAKEDRHGLGSAYAHIDVLKPTPEWKEYSYTFKSPIDAVKFVIKIIGPHISEGGQKGQKLYITDVRLMELK